MGFVRYSKNIRKGSNSIFSRKKTHCDYWAIDVGMNVHDLLWLGAGGSGDLRSGSSCWWYPWYWTTIRSIILIIYSQDEFWRATSKYLGHCGSGWHSYLPIVVMGHPKSPDLGRSSPPSPTLHLSLTWFTPDGSLMENPPALNLHLEGFFFICSYHVPTCFSHFHPHLERIFPWRPPFIGDVPMLFIWFSHDSPIFSHPQTVTVLAWAGYAQWSRTQLLGEVSWRGKSSGKPNWFVILGKL